MPAKGWEPRADALRARLTPACPPSCGASVIVHSRFIASLIGPIVVAVGLSLLLNPGLAIGIAADLASSPSLMIVSGMAAMLLGLLIVRTHNVWRGWPITVTLFGWVCVIGGAFRILLPDVAADMATVVAAPHEGLTPFAGGAAILVGLFFAWQGWSVPLTAAPTDLED